MNGAHELHYIVLRYAPMLLSDDGLNLGLVLFDPREVEDGYCNVSFFSNWQSKVLRFDPEADIEMLEAITQDIERRLTCKETRWEMLHLMEDSFSNMIRVSVRQECRTQDSALEFATLLQQFS